jgi:hypothetical protein
MPVLLVTYNIVNSTCDINVLSKNWDYSNSKETKNLEKAVYRVSESLNRHMCDNWQSIRTEERMINC